MLPNQKSKVHTKAVLQALFVTLLWSSSWVFIKTGLKDMPPLTFAGLRYFLGFCFLLPMVLTKDRSALQNLKTRQWAELTLLGVIMYAVTQGAQFLSLLYFPAIFTALILNFTPILVTFLSVLFLKEKSNWVQHLGVAICFLGACLYFIPKFQGQVKFNHLVLVPVLGMIANGCASILGRAINRREHLPARVVTGVSMGIGSVILLSVGIVNEPFPDLNLQQVFIILWLAGINTAFAFTLWNYTLRSLSSVESSVINNTMMVQISLLAVFVLGERLGVVDSIALILASAGSLIVQVRRPSQSVLQFKREK